MLSASLQSMNTYSISPQAIDAASEKIVEFCTALKLDRKTIAKYRLSAEESLSLWMREFGENAEFELEFGKKLFRNFFRIRIKGAQFNPYNNREQTRDFGTAANGILVRIGLMPEYSYYDETSILTFYLKGKPKNQILVLLGIIFFSLTVGFGSKLLVNADIISSVSSNFLTPVEDTFFNILSAIAGPMVFLSVAWGIYGIGDVYTLGRIGKKMMLSYVKTIFFFVAIGVFFYPFLGPPLTTSSAGTSQFSSVFKMLLSVFPSNVFSPFIEGNTLQIIFLAFILGLSLMFLGHRTTSIARAIEQINYIISFLMEFVSKLVPYFVFIVLVSIIWSDTLSSFSEVWKLTVVFLTAVVICFSLFLAFVCVKHKQNPIKMLSAILPSFLIAISTASSSATFESNMKVCSNRFGINKELSSFGIPFGMVIFKPTTALYYLLVCFYFSSVNNAMVSVSWIITAVIITAISAIATPPIPGGAAATYTILFSQLGISPKSLFVVVAIDMIFDFVLTSSDMSMLLLQMYHLSNKMGMRDKSKQLK